MNTRLATKFASSLRSIEARNWALAIIAHRVGIAKNISCNPVPENGTLEMQYAYNIAIEVDRLLQN